MRLLSPALPARVEFQRPLEGLEVVPPVRSPHRVARGSFAEPALELGLMDHVRQLVGVQHVREVHERPRDRGHRDALVRRDIARVQRPCLVHPNPGGHAATCRDNDINEGGPVLTDLPELRRGQMTQRRPLTCPKNRRQESTLAGEPGMADGVHAPVHAVQQARPHAPRDRALVQARGEKLRQRHQAVLPGRQSRERAQGVSSLTLAGRHFPTAPPDDGSALAHGSRRICHESAKKLPGRDSNPNYQSQNLACCQLHHPATGRRISIGRITRTGRSVGPSAQVFSALH